MSTSWAVSLAKADAGGAGSLRLAADVEVCETAERVWLRGPSSDDALLERLRAIPGALRYWVLNGGQLRRFGARVPQGRLPAGPWAALADWMEVALPPAGWPGAPAERVPLTLVRSAEPLEPNVLLTSLDDWTRYGRGAPQVRLEAWSFAADDAGRAIVRGAPLPPLPGQRFVERQGAAVPAGWHWSPAVDAEVVRELLELDGSDLGLLWADGSWERIEGQQFVRATRSAVRLTSRGATP